MLFSRKYWNVNCDTLYLHDNDHFFCDGMLKKPPTYAAFANDEKPIANSQTPTAQWC